MSISKANKLFQEGKYKEAETLYRKLYEENNLEIYKFGIEFSQEKQKSSLDKEINNKDGANPVNKRILFITAGLKGPTAGGGIATCFHSMVKTMGLLSNSQTDVLYIAHPYYSKGNYEEWKEVYKDECKANLIKIDINNFNYGSKEMKRSYAILEFLIENEYKYDRVVFHDFMGLAYFPLLAKKIGLALKDIKFIISAHGNHILSNFFGKRKIESWDMKAIIFMERMSLHYADEITSPSIFYKDWLAKNLEVDQNKVKVLPNILYRDDRTNSLNVKYKDKTKKLIAFYGRIERLKGIDLLIDAIKLLNKEKNIYNILIAGVSTKIDGLDAKDYINKALNCIDIEVQYQFNCQPVEVFNFIKAHQGVCILPTLGENAPCVVVECILHGVPFLASNIPGIKEMVATKYHETYLFETGSLQELVKKMRWDMCPPTMEVLSYNMAKVEQEWVSFLEPNYNQLVINQNFEIDIEKIFISVIIPTCDRPELLKIAIESISQQSYKNFEVIIVDDASVNPEVNQALARQYNCKYIYLKDKSYKGSACNIAFQYAKGEYVCFFDDDDIAHPEMLQRYVIAFNNFNDADILSGFCEVFEHKDSNINNGEVPNTTYTSLALGGGLEVNLSINMFGKGTFIVNSEVFKKIGGYEVDISPVPMVDYRFYLKAALAGAKISIVPFSQYYYRKNSPKSLYYISGNNREQQFLAKTSIQDIIERHISKDLGRSIAPMIWNISLPNYN